MRIDQCNSIKDFRLMARRRLPGPIFHYIDGAADDEVTYRRNTEAYERCDLVPNVLAGVESIDMSTTVVGQKLKMPLYGRNDLRTRRAFLEHREQRFDVVEFNQRSQVSDGDLFRDGYIHHQRELRLVDVQTSAQAEFLS